MLLPYYVEMLHDSADLLVDAYRTIAAGHPTVADVVFTCLSFGRQVEAQARELEAIATLRYLRPDRVDDDILPERMLPTGFSAARPGALGLLRDLAELQQLAVFVENGWIAIGQAAYGQRDDDLIRLMTRATSELDVHDAWIRNKLTAEAAQTLLVARL